MSFSRRACHFGALVALAACDYTPVYAPGGSGEGLRGAFTTREPDNRAEFDFVAQFEERMGRPQLAEYELAYDLKLRSTGVGITPAQETTRYNVFGTVRYRVIDLATKRVLYEGTTENFTGYSATSLIVGTESVTRDAEQRLMVILADQVVTRLLATSEEWRL